MSTKLRGLTGWLSPTGRFYPCEYGQHGDLATELIKESHEMIERRIDLISKSGTVIAYEDAIRHMDWIKLGAGASWLEPQMTSGDHYIFFPTHRRDWSMSQQQIKWFRENADRLSIQQQTFLQTQVERELKLRHEKTSRRNRL